MKAVKSNTAYNNAVLLTATKAVRAFGYRYNVDAMKAEEFLNSQAFADKVAAHGQYLDTPARLASFVSSIYKDVSEKRVTVTKKTPLTISEIKLLLQMVAVGFMTRDEARAKVAKGKFWLPFVVYRVFLSLEVQGLAVGSSPTKEHIIRHVTAK